MMAPCFEIPSLPEARSFTGRLRSDRGGRTSFHAAFGLFHEYPLLIVPTVTEVHDGEELLSLRASLPLSAQAWRSPGRRLPQPATFPSQVITGGPGLRVPFA